ncbi:MAG: hypothetical protein JF887_12485 [Candidatus Dormibacteraeota bacterium]|uniref:Baseplate protein J-like domain-containing protein n=1 Tax=Candidatus Amunia macphersoniae TaxID=3127014 RepID=A0A934KR07_9BACT|nr:hypothetical protein [Candidatus Dormibacteraeota bacterium]
MPQVIYGEQGDEIVDLIDKVRGSDDSEVALVLGSGAHGLQTPLNVRLLRQLGARAGKTVSIVSGDPHLQELSRVGGLPTYASVPAYERGIQTVRPHGDDGLAGGAWGVVAGATAPPAPPAPPPSSATVSPGAGLAAARPGVGGRRRPLYFALAGLVVLGLILFFVVVPSATVTITLAGTPLSINPTIQGGADPANAGQADHIVTAVVSSTQSAQFMATPTGQQQNPAAKATSQIVLATDLPAGASSSIPANTEFDTQDNPPIQFFSTQAVTVILPPPSAGQQYGTPSNPIPVQERAAEAKGNVAANTITQWPMNPCNPGQPYAAICRPSDITSTNPTAATGGADAKNNTVASSGDVNGWNNQVTQSNQTLTAQVNQDMQSKAAGKTFAKDPGGNGTTVACTVTPPLPAVNAVFTPTQETVACNGKAAIYSPGDITNDVNADLQQQVAHGDSLATDSINCTKPAVTQAVDDGTVVLSIQCTSFSRPTIDTNALKAQITGKSAGDARNVIQHRLNHVQNVAISQGPIPFFWLPFFSSRIQIDEAVVAQTPGGP